MKPRTPSATALRASLMRALHARTDPHPVLDDPWGDRLVPAEARAALYEAVRTQVPGLPEHPGESTMRSVLDVALRSVAAYANVVLRSRHAEEALERALARGVRQYVLVGAGFDSYALRRPPSAAGLRVVEIDHPDTQALKRACIAKSGVALPDTVDFVAADLAQETLAAALRRSALRLSEPAFFSWLGVTMYLSREANLATLRDIAATAAPGSELVFSYLDAAVLRLPEADQPEPFRALRERVAASGEPFLSGFDPATLARDLAPLGLAVVEDLSDDELARRYDPEGRNGFVTSAHSRIAHART